MTAPAAWVPTTGNVVLAITMQNTNSALTVPTPWGTWSKLLSLSGGAGADGNGNYWDIHAVVVGSSPASAAPSVGQPSVCTGEAYFVEIPSLSTNLGSLLVQWSNASKTSTSGDRTMSTNLSAFSSPGNLCFALKAGFGSQPWTAVSPLVILAQYTNSGAADYTASAYYNGQVLAPEIDGSSPGNGMAIIAMELQVQASGIPASYFRC